MSGAPRMVGVACLCGAAFLCLVACSVQGGGRDGGAPPVDGLGTEGAGHVTFPNRRDWTCPIDGGGCIPPCGGIDAPECPVEGLFCINSRNLLGGERGAGVFSGCYRPCSGSDCSRGEFCKSVAYVAMDTGDDGGVRKICVPIDSVRRVEGYYRAVDAARRR